MWNSAGGAGHAHVLMMTSARMRSGLDKRIAQAGRTAPVVTDERDALEVELPQQRDQIRRVAVEAVRVFARGLLGQAEADHVGDHDAVAGLHQRRNEIAVQEAPGRIAVQQDDRVARAFVDVVHAPAVDPREPRCIRPLLSDMRWEIERRHRGGGRGIVHVDAEY